MAYRCTLVVVEVTGEDLLGAETSRRTSVGGIHALVSKGARLTATGLTDADKAVDLLDPTGYGTAWSVKAGDRIISIDGEMTVSSATPIRSLRTGVVKHIEVVSG